MTEFKVPDYMIGKLEENLKLFDEELELRKKLRPEHKTLIEGTSLKTHEDIIWFALCAQENELKERTEHKKQMLADREGE